MCVRKKPLLAPFIVLLTLGLSLAGAPRKTAKTGGVKAERVSTGPAVMWNNPKDLKSRDLFYGAGGKEHAPKGTFTFVEEDREGGSPKFVVRDDEGVKWKAKLGLEARPETVCTRLLWAVGYYANEDYFVHDLKVLGMPPRLHRGREFVDADGSVHNVRLKREDKKIGIWQWRHDAFTGTRELNGLRVMMAVINNWDLKDENNAIYQVRGEHPYQLYEVSDLGASFGTTGFSWTRRGSKGNLKAYEHSKFVKRATPEYVTFYVPSRPALDHYPEVHQVKLRLKLRWIGKEIPRSDAKWMGDLLGRLSAQQIRDAFRAASYSAGEVEAFSRVVEDRIAELRSL
jgi:hypothetical protein